MFRFVALVWDHARQQSAESARMLGKEFRRSPAEWECVYEHEGIEIFCAGLQTGPSRAYRLHDAGGVILGVLFDRLQLGESGHQKLQLHSEESRRIRESCGRDLVTSYWGRYVAVIRSAAGPHVYVIRDPSGAVDCYSASVDGGVQLYFSSMRPSPALDKLRLSIDWDYVAASACGALPESRNTGFKEISHVVRGQCVETTSGAKCFYWSPVPIAESAQDGDFGRLACELRETVRSCVQTWASCYDHITQSLSGGLDSSIILACIAGARDAPRVTCLNYYYRSGSGGDEREFARLMAGHVRRPLIERELDARVRLDGIRGAPRSDCPFDFVPYYDIEQTDINAGGSLDSDARFHGLAGDQLFYQNGAHQSVADCLLGARLHPRLIGFAAEAASAEENTVWSVLIDGFRMAFLRDRYAPVVDAWLAPSVVRPAVKDVVRKRMPFVHPWLKEGSTIPPGKVWQIHLLTLSDSERTYGPFWKPGDTEAVCPLASQPIVELCLRIPTYVLMANGRDRSLVRQAFREDLPQQIVQRRSKGIVCEHPKALFDFNREFIREMLLDGLLVRQGILDRAGLENALANEVAKHDVSPEVLFSWLSIESWAQQQRALPACSMAA